MPPPKGQPGRQQLVIRTAAELVALVGPDSEVAVSQASLRKLIGSAGVDRLRAEDLKRIAEQSTKT